MPTMSQNLEEKQSRGREQRKIRVHLGTTILSRADKEGL